MKDIFDVNMWVTGEKFLGREEEVKKLMENVFQPALQGKTRYFSVTGMNRIGKTSLVKEVCRRFDLQPHPNVLIVETIVSDYSRFWAYWVYGVLKPLRRKLKVESGLSDGDLEGLDELFDFFDHDTFAP